MFRVRDASAIVAVSWIRESEGPSGEERGPRRCRGDAL